MVLLIPMRKGYGILYLKCKCSVQSGEDDNGLSGKCFSAPELAHQKSENIGGTPELFSLQGYVRVVPSSPPATA
jgi:hypothetical protein